MNYSDLVGKYNLTKMGDIFNYRLNLGDPGNTIDIKGSLKDESTVRLSVNHFVSMSDKSSSSVDVNLGDLFKLLRLTHELYPKKCPHCDKEIGKK